MKEIQVRCPSCGRVGNIEISEDAMKKIARGILTVNISSNNICTHSLVVYVDTNFQIRNCVVADFQINLPESDISEKIEDNIIPEKKLIDLDIIRLNLPPIVFAYILKSIFFKKKIVLILEESFLSEYVLNLFKYLTYHNFDFDLSLLSKEEYRDNKKKLSKDHMVFEGLDIIRNVDKIINPKQLRIEKQIVNKFLSINDFTISLITFRNEIQKIYVFSKSIAEFIHNYENKELLNSKIIIDYLREVYDLKKQDIVKEYLDFLIEVVKSYFEIENFKISDIEDFLLIL